MYLNKYIIFCNQFNFIEGWQIQNCIIAVLECVNILDRKCFNSNIAMKIDVRKVFDTFHLDFFISVLGRFGFSDIFCF